MSTHNSFLSYPNPTGLRISAPTGYFSEGVLDGKRTESWLLKVRHSQSVITLYFFWIQIKTYLDSFHIIKKCQLNSFLMWDKYISDIQGLPDPLNTLLANHRGVFCSIAEISKSASIFRFRISKLRLSFWVIRLAFRGK